VENLKGMMCTIIFDAFDVDNTYILDDNNCFTPVFNCGRGYCLRNVFCPVIGPVVDLPIALRDTGVGSKEEHKKARHLQLSL